jgi:hypothetical protein
MSHRLRKQQFDACLAPKTHNCSYCLFSLLGYQHFLYYPGLHEHRCGHWNSIYLFDSPRWLCSAFCRFQELLLFILCTSLLVNSTIKDWSSNHHFHPCEKLNTALNIQPFIFSSHLCLLALAIALHIQVLVLLFSGSCIARILLREK